MGVSENSGTPKSSILLGFAIKKSIHFGIPLFLETHTYLRVIPTKMVIWRASLEIIQFK